MRNFANFMGRNSISILLVSLLFTSSCATKLSKVLKSKDVEYKYKIAEQYYANKKYAEAQKIFEADVFNYLKGTTRYEDVYYKYAYTYFYTKDYLNAENMFKSFVENFPTSTRGEECEYMRAYCYYKQSPKIDLDQTNTTKTMGLLQAFISTHPTSKRVKDAVEIIDLCREKLELKEFKSAELYYNLGFYKAAAIAFSNVSDNFPDSKKSDEYKFLMIKSYFKYAEMSYEEKQRERYEKVLTECNEFVERFTDSKHLENVNKYKTQTNNIIKNLRK
jgi:outer membrane protein assembly factor BamD